LAIFRRDDPGPPTADRNPGRPGSPSNGRTSATRIAAGTRIEGRVLGAAEVQVEGEIAGSVNVDGRVSIVAGGRVEGDVEARVVEIAGRVEGDVTASERIEMSASGVAEGDLSAPRVVIAEGAFFRGSVDMSGGHSAAGTRAPTKPAAGGPT
jgi:cytoskeletal protein CcmA (bactofilin family)